MAISRQAVKEFAGRQLDDHRWIKQVARERLMREVATLRVPPAFKTDPWLHQLACWWIGLHYPRFLFLLDMGLGKTKIISDLFTQLLREKRARRALVGVPRVINIDSWADDLAVHSDLEPNLVSVEDIEGKRELLLNPTGDVTVVDFAGLHLALSAKGYNAKGKRALVRDDRLVRQAQRLYDFVGVDEIHKLSNKENLWFSIWRMLTKEARYAYGSTGTLFGKDPLAAWAPFFLIDRGETLGENVGVFREAFFTAKFDQWKGQVWTYDKSKAPVLNRMLQHRSLRYEEDEVLDLPKRVPRLRVVDMSEEQRGHYMRALEGLINSGGSLRDLEAPWVRMRQITSGYLAWKDGTGDHVLRFKRNPKLDWLESKLEEMGDSKVVVCYDYTETGRMICERVKAMGLDYEWYYGGTRDQSASRRRFLDDPGCRVFVMNSQAGGTGNDGLQKVARYMIFYESPSNPIDRRQTEKRIHRPGQEQRSFIWDVVAQGTLDGGILAQIAEGVDVHKRVVDGKLPSRNFFLTQLPRG